MGESDLQAAASKNCNESDSSELANGKVFDLKNNVQSFLKSGKVHEALNLYIEAYSSDFLDSECLEVFVDGVVRKARNYLSTNQKLTVERLFCDKCKNVITDPVTLKCGHTFSKKCVLSEVKDDNFECKKCSKFYSLGYLSQLKNSVTIASVIDKITAALNCSDDSEVTNPKHSQDNKCDPAAYWGSAKDELLSSMEVQSEYFFQPSFPKDYLRKGDALVNCGKFEEAVETYLKCFTLDFGAIRAKEAAIKMLHHLLLRLSSFRLHKNSFYINSTSLQGKKTLTGSDGSIDSAGSNESEPCLCDESYCNDDSETKDWNAAHLNECLEGAKLHLMLKRFYHDIENTAGSKSISENIEISSLDKQDFECPLCMRILWEPVTTTCGHSFCRVCLNRCLDHQPSCPLCKTSLAAFLAERIQSTTEFLELAIKTLLPSEYADRKAVYLQEMEELSNAGKDLEHVIPLFVCTIAYPTVPCPLHVFEPRYRLMIRQCMESGSRQFGMCAYIDDNIAEYGTMLEIKNVQYFPDGRSVIDTVGSRRFRILKKGERDGYHTGAVEFLKDDAISSVDLEDVKEKHDRVLKYSQSWFMHLPQATKHQILDHFGPMPPVETNYLFSPNGPSWIWWMLAVLPLEPKLQLRILSMTSLSQRLNTLFRVLLHLQSVIS